MPIVEQKKRLRAVSAERREGLEAGFRADAAQVIAENGLGFAHLQGDETVSAYHPIDAELDCLPLMARLAGAGHATALPVIARRGERLVFRRWAPGEPLAEGRGGIPIPAADAPVVEPQVLLVPLLAFDRRGYRLGYGGGYYDRTLTALRRQGPILAIGFAFAAQEVPAVPNLDYDARLDWVLTEEGPIAIEGSSDAPALRR